MTNSKFWLLLIAISTAATVLILLPALVGAEAEPVQQSTALSQGSGYAIQQAAPVQHAAGVER